jgi:hypothetical protein
MFDSRLSSGIMQTAHLRAILGMSLLQSEQILLGSLNLIPSFTAFDLKMPSFLIIN